MSAVGFKRSSKGQAGGGVTGIKGGLTSQHSPAVVAIERLAAALKMVEVGARGNF